MTDEVRIWEEPLRGAFGDPAGLALSGVERMRLFVKSRLSRPPTSHLTGLMPVETGFGTSTFSMPVSPWLQTVVPGVMPAGVIAFLADAPLGTAISTVLPPLGYMTTSDLSMNFLQPATLESGTLIGRGRLLHGGLTVGLSEITVEDSNGRLIAHGTSRGFLLKMDGSPPAKGEAGPPPAYPTPDPYLRRPVAGSPVPHETWNRLSGLEVLRQCIASGPKPPIYHLTGLRPTEVAEGSCTFVLPASAWLASPAPVLYGGSIAMLADAALSGAVMTICPPGSSYGPLDLRVTYVRPVMPDGGLMTARATLIHRGRTLVVASAELFNADDKRVALATSSVMLLPGRPWSEIAPEFESEFAGQPE